MKKWTDDEGMEIFSKAFTHKTADSDNNYEILEFLGDKAANHAISLYLYNKFPQLHCTDGVKILARLDINNKSKASFYPIAESLGFWPFISGWKR